MAVVLRCPDCREKLTLPAHPEPGTEVECPGCGNVFVAPDPETGEVPGRGPKKRPRDDDGEDDEKPRKKKKRPVEDDGEDEDDAAPPKKPAAGKAKGGKGPGEGKPARRRKAKKKETNKTALIALVAGGVLFLVLLIGLLVWFFSRKPVAYEMMNYVPDDSTAASGLNIGHMQKYPEFYNKLESSFADLGFKKATETTAKALGAEPNDLVDSMVQGSGKSGEALVLRTKKEFDVGGLAKLPGAREGTADGQKYYSVNKIEGLWGKDLRVFAPTNRLIVFCSAGMSDGAFRKILGGNKDNFDNTIPGKFGPLAKRTMKGTFWAIVVMDPDTRPKAPDKKAGGPGNGGSGGEFDAQVATSLSNAKAFGFKSSLGSRAVRFEVIIQCRDAEDASNAYQKYKDSDLAKGDEVEPPRWWKEFAQTTIANKKLGIELFSNLGAKSSGELFVVYSECDTKLLMEAINSLAGKITGTKPGGGTAPMPPPTPAK